MEVKTTLKIKLVFILTTLLVFSLFSVESNAFKKEDKIYKNIYIENIDLSKLTIKEATNRVQKYINENEKITLNYNDKEFNTTLKEIGVNYEIDKAVKQAYEVSRDKEYIRNIKTKVSLNLKHKKVIKLNYTIDESKISSFIDTIKQTIEKDAVDATIKLENEKFVVTKDVDGINLNTELLVNKVKKKAKNLKYEINEVPIKLVQAKYKYNELIKVDTVLGKYETKFNKGLKERVANLQIAANATTNKLLLNNEKFSFNESLSFNKVRNTFKEAPIIINGKLAKGKGGGICQISTTIYNAVLYSGLEVLEVRNHSIPSAYAKKGRDATVTNGQIDFKFINSYKNPIYIVNEIKDNKVISTIYGSKEDKKDIEVITEVVEVLPHKFKTKANKELLKGEKELEKGRKGYKVKTFRINKNTNIKEFIVESFYPPHDEITYYGTKEKIKILDVMKIL